MTMVWKRHLAGIRGVIAGGGAVGALAHSLATGVAGIAGGVGVLGAEAAHRMIVNRLATDPELAQRFIFALKNNVPPRYAGTLLAAMMAAQRGAQRRDAEEQLQNAGNEQTQP
jgi:hypothetical protein